MTEKKPETYGWKQTTATQGYRKELSLEIIKNAEMGAEDSLKVEVVENGKRTFLLSLIRGRHGEKTGDEKKYYSYNLEIDVDVPDKAVSLSIDIQDYNMESFHWLDSSAATITNLIKKNGLENVVEEVIDDVKRFAMNKVKIGKE
jgi:hypothetical protein